MEDMGETRWKMSGRYLDLRSWISGVIWTKDRDLQVVSNQIRVESGDD